MAEARLVPLGDAAIVIELGRSIDPTINARVHALDRDLREGGLPRGVVELVPTYRSLLVHYDPLLASFEELSAELRPLVGLAGRSRVGPRGWGRSWGPTGADEPGEEPAVIEIPTVYGGEAGPDLPDVARHAGLSEEEVLRRHAAGEYRVAMLGFAPGFPYLMGMDPSIACPRLATPRIRVPAGSVGIADAQTGIYPFAMPGGWRLIGRTALSLFDARRDPPATLRPGSSARFVPTRPEAHLLAPGAEGAGRASREARPVAVPARTIRVLEPGPLATVQDGGRFGYQRYGVPPSGAADGLALALGNLAAGNEREAAGIEITAGGAEFEFTHPARFAVTGADADLILAGRQVAPWEPLAASVGERLRIGLARSGIRVYLCVAGGVSVEPVLGSRSTYLPGGFGGFDGHRLRPGDEVPLGPAPRAGHISAVPQRLRLAPASRTVEVPFLPGAEWDALPPPARRRLLDRPWRVSHRSDRIGLRLEGEPIAAGRVGAFVSDGTVTGTVQLAGDGLPVVLLVDRQTIGGYPRLGAVAQIGHPLLGQARAGDEIVFRPISLGEAQQELKAAETRIEAFART